MRVLALTLTLPFPATNGHKIRNWAVLRALRAEGHEIMLLTFADPAEMGSGHEKISEVCAGVHTVPFVLPRLSSFRNVAGVSRALLSAIPYGVRRFQSKAMRDLIAARLRDGTTDVVFCETSYAAVNLPAALPVPLIVDNQNVEHLLLRRYAAQTRNLAKRMYVALESRKFARWERETWRRAAHVLACSEYDRTKIRELCPFRSASVAPNVVDVESYAPSSGGNGRTLLYAGGMDWFPNRDAVEYFAFQILPELRRCLPGTDLRFVVAGRNPPDAFRRRLSGARGLVFTGTVPDMRAEIARADVCVVPLRVGSGTRLKILEAAAMEKAIVSTRIGAEGLDFTDGSEIRLEDDPAGFAHAVADLLSNLDLRRTLGRAARQRVERQYSMAALRRALRDVLPFLKESSHGSVTRQPATEATS